ncbi:hypothetical protein ACFWPA_18505 [Rhodococcus sp. NPDC058505]|uniref:hypothetical protein n=1 Tax=unclassified Rhodococcus (in: high G+C Gram-positive bacteria) TaxID=192944 RepID=UPI003650B658
MTGRRTLAVEVENIAIEDGEAPLPRVGSVIALSLRFVELPPATDDVVTMCAPLEPDPGPPIQAYAGEDTPRRTQWSGLLRGDGWTASWRGFRPRTGQVELTGRFHCVLGDDAGRVRGRVTRVRIVSERFRRRPGPGTAWNMSAGHRRLRDVDVSPRFFDREALYAQDRDEADSDVGVLIDLELDDVPTLPTRPSIVPGGVSAAGGRLWVSDCTLPVVVSIDRDRTVREHVLPAPIGPSRRVWATPTGCWVGGRDGLFRCADDAEPRRVGDGAAHTAVVLGDALLVCRAEGAWVLHRPDADPVEIDAPHGHVAAIASDRAVAIAAVALDNSTIRLVRVDPTGAATIGPELRHSGRSSRLFLAGSPSLLFLGDHAVPVLPDLTLGTPRRLPSTVMVGGQVGPYAWTVNHPPDGSGRSGWWPLPGPVDYDRGRQFWLFTLLDPHTLEPVRSTPILATRPSVTVDDDGAVWVVAEGVRSIPDATMRWPEVLDVAALLDASRSREPRPPRDPADPDPP